ncbi:hypothetical protein JTE90_020731 [Oedothorax gibbosus]|uniref:THAP-type domain-containing protein n=1 Tax=Oedothorax gibbosus TaxID=931172 RepID=A0AAV6V5Y4_9ARAC|nr:hypothetical protein JTE90_020731 [Oedothorax gibbosus]
MVNSCSANGCKNRNTKGGTLTFHRFPLNNKHMLKLWLYQIKRGSWEPSKYSVICSEHFTEDSFVVKTNNRRTLKNDACPTIFTVANYTEPPKKKKNPRERNLMEVDPETTPEPVDAMEAKEETNEEVATTKNGTSTSKEEEDATDNKETPKEEESSPMTKEDVQEESQ